MINLYINESRAGQVAILNLKGRVSFGGNTIALHKSIRCLILEDKTQVLLNLAGVTHMDSTGLGELIASQITLLKKGGELKLLNLTESLRELMSLAKLTDVFDIYDDEAAALQSFREKVRVVKEPHLFFV